MPDLPQPPKEESKKGFFGSAKEQPSSNIVQDIAGQVNNVSRTVKTIEDRFSTMRKKVQVTEQNMITNDKKIFSDMKVMSSQIMDIKADMADLKEKLTLLVKELKLTATKEEVKIIEKYLSYWEPLSFVTRQELAKTLLENQEQR